jgi:hypothetical protein
MNPQLAPLHKTLHEIHLSETKVVRTGELKGLIDLSLVPHEDEQAGRQDAPQDQKRGTEKDHQGPSCKRLQLQQDIRRKFFACATDTDGVSNLSRIPPTVLAPGARYLAPLPSLRVPGFLYRICRLQYM